MRHLVRGTNEVVITVQNGPDWFAGGHGNGTYSGNPASLVAEISIPAADRQTTRAQGYAQVEVAGPIVVEESYEVPPAAPCSSQRCGMGQLVVYLVIALAFLGVALGLILGLRYRARPAVDGDENKRS